MAPFVETEEKAEKGLSSVNTPGDRFAYWLSQITSPFVVGLAVLGYVALSTAPAVTDGLRWLTVIGVGLLVPFGFIWWGVKQGKLTDIHVSRRSQRLVPLLVGLIALGGMLAGLLLLSASRPLVATLVAVFVSYAAATLITHVAKYKISLHRLYKSTDRNYFLAVNTRAKSLPPDLSEICFTETNEAVLEHKVSSVAPRLPRDC